MAHDCVGALLVRDGRVLLGRRAPNRAWLPDAWDLFGGHIEPGESPEAALHRELAEELGVRALEWDWVGTLEGGDWRLRVARVRAWSGEPHNRQPAEHAHIEWCGLPTAQARLAAAHAGFPPMLARVLADGT
ncbi:NUDIX domain-containing protein [Agrilutibacter solisilvae]|uniref:8-oxo-dGTP diphosphatase n=1 Tax=Agrilutibacter solisilvae TaxID=2763317 RepID=A0A974Y1A7_9GAMM|nr:NUDIX domain-containing protein [Lysobacter solisilvae]QSX79592.1 NUDIX domain-containing protein [Lysobacter solisilvae]